ncbi:MAG: nucleoside-specific channel-forming Tsx family protein [Hoylesella marshii]|uniref:DUF5020 domain-containing protein n=1 Tax=Hoylesella marshii DSM 16973 = JCM 13450 TaxID=862515 RepID=E0NQ13_9BACT|nr:DUF5020 family protein [Hoylesella marshii]EFM02775.1 hypothetical protein HMPREF0658_0264 [Hoylesella marshii DSM 16973 = JCM 13450]
MRKFFMMTALCLTATGAFAQNIQFHYDLGHSLYNELSDRGSATTTIELFKPDKFGNTYTFTDIDYETDGVKGAYWEIAREFNLTADKRWAAHIEYNGGLTSDKQSMHSTRFQHAVLAGGAWNWASSDFSKTFSVQLLYKYYFKGKNPWNRPFSGVQLTEVWSTTFARKLCTFSGFCDLWYDRSVKGNLIVVSEPQFWFNLNALKGLEDVQLSLGTEVEVSNNFVFNKRGENNRFYAIPTLAAKWTF